jgi:PAS domain S-box-containing protein
MATLINSHDWSASPLGNPAGWPEGLKIPLRMMLASRFEMWLGWGADLHFFYNDAYIPTLGRKHPSALGRPTRDVWQEIFADVEGRFRSVMQSGVPTWDKALLLLLERNGYPEETYHTFSYSPLQDGDKIGGLMCVVTEETERVISERRLDTLRALADALVGAQSRQAVAEGALAALAGNKKDFPFSLFYLLDANGAPTAFAPDHVPQHLRSLKISPVVETASLADIPDLPTGDWTIPPQKLLLVPVAKAGQQHPSAMLALALNPYRPQDTEIANFAQLIATQIAGALATIDALEAASAERERLAQMFQNAPSFMCQLTGPQHVFTFTNAAYQQLIAHRDVIGKSVREALPEIAGQGFYELLDDVYARGEAYRGYGLPVTLQRTPGATPETRLLDFVYQPVRDASGAVTGIFTEGIDVTESRANTRLLAENEERLRIALSAANSVGAWDWDVASDRVIADTGFATMYGVAPERASKGAPIAEFFGGIHPDDVARVQAEVEKALASGEAFSSEYRLRQTDGPDKWVVASGRCTLSAEGKPLRFAGLSFDITARKEIETRLRASEEQFRSMAQAVPNHVWTAPASGLLDWFNDQVYAYSGAAPGTLTGTGWTAMVHPDDLAEAARRWAQALETGQTYETQFRLRRADGQWRWHLARAVAVKDGHGVATRWVGTNTDIHDQKQTAEALQNLNAHLEAKVLEQSLARGRTWQVSPNLMGVANAQGYFEASNPAWQTILGWTPEEVETTYLFDFVHPDDIEATRGGLAALIRNEPLLPFENRYRCKDGSYRWISWVAVPEQGKFYCTGRDVTEEKEREAQLLQTQDALRQAQKMEAVGQLTGGIAHDFNNLLQGIIGALDRVQYRIAQGRIGDVDRFLKAAVESANRAASLTHRLLAFSRRQTLDPKPLDVNRLIGGMEDLLRRSVGPTITVEVVGAGGLWPVKVDASQLENSILNLCINARDAMPGGGALTIETANKWLDERAAKDRELPPGQYVSLCVTDTGTGMTPEVIARAFDPFYTTKPLGQGTGLGLSMIYGFVRQSGGQVRIYSEINKGTTMCLYLPRYLGDVTEDPAGPSEPMERGFGETVLVVDDEPTVRMLISEVLSENFYHILEAGDGAAALKILESDQPIAMMITDVGLPGGMNGRQVADAARVLRKDLKVLFITGYAENAAVGNGHLEAGMEILTKPFAMTTLANKVREMIER